MGKRKPEIICYTRFGQSISSCESVNEKDWKDATKEYTEFRGDYFNRTGFYVIFYGHTPAGGFEKGYMQFTLYFKDKMYYYSDESHFKTKRGYIAAAAAFIRRVKKEYGL